MCYLVNCMHSTPTHIYIYMYICICVYVYMCIYVCMTDGCVSREGLTRGQRFKVVESGDAAAYPKTEGMN